MGKGERVILDDEFTALESQQDDKAKQHLWACAYAAAMTFIHGGEDGLGEGRGLYGTRQALTYSYSDTRLPGGVQWDLAVWRNSEGVNVAPVDEG